MGTPPLIPAATLFSTARYDHGGPSALARHAPATTNATSPSAALRQSNRPQHLAEAFDAAVYQSFETRQAVSLNLASVQGTAGNGGSNVGFQNTQLTFDFFSESRYESLAVFNQRTGAVGDGLEGPRKASFFAAREEIATRFQLSVKVSGAALNGFVTTAEGAAQSNELLDRLLEVTGKLLGKADELLDGFFAQLDGSDGGFSAEKLNALFDEFIAEFLDTLSGEFLSAFGLPANPGAPGGNSVQATAVQLEFSFEFSARVSSTQVVQQGDPIVLDLDGDGIELSDYREGARFDLTGSGRAQQVAFVRGGDAFLALDRNGDGQINSGKELFGEQHGARNGFEELRKFDGNGDGIINRDDAVFNELRLFRDNGNGITEAGELLTLVEAGIQEIDLGYRDTNERAAGGNRITQIASFLRSDGTRGQAVDALLNYIA